MHIHTRPNPDKSTHHTRQPFFNHDAARQQSSPFFALSSVLGPPTVQKKCAACEAEERVQTKLTIGQPDDQYEREADAVAERVVGQSETKIQRQELPEEEEEVQAKPLPGDANLSIQRQVKEENEEEDLVQTKSQSNTKAGDSASFASSIQSTQGSGHTLTGSTRNFFESRIGHDFSGVKLHTDSRANNLARSINARAFTHKSDIYFNTGEYQPHSSKGKHLLAHELTHVVQQSHNRTGEEKIQRWAIGGAPAPAGWSVVTDPRHIRRLNQAETIVRGVLTSRNCQNYFRDNCTNGAGAVALQQAFDNARIYLRPFDDNVFGEQSGVSSNIAFNLRAFRIGRFMMASSLLHEMFHTCDPIFDAADELDAENAVETCRLHTPWIDEVTPRRGAVGSRVTIRGWGLGPTQGATDEVRIGGVSATIISWTFMTDASSRVEIVAEVPAGAAAGGITVINNRVTSNNSSFTVV